VGFGKRLEVAGDVGAVGSAEPGLGEQLGKPRADLHVGAGRCECFHEDTREFVETVERGQDADATQVVLLDE
jgi:hypothetical protein